MTLIELIVVMVVLALLAGLVGPQVFRHLGTGRTSTARTQIELFSGALDHYRMDNFAYPTTEQGLAALWQQPTTGAPPRAWKGPYVKKAIPTDPWGNPYVYRFPGEKNPQGSAGYDLLSLGADGREGGEGDDADIASWE